MPTFAQLVVWIVVGFVGGSLAARLITWDRAGLGLWQNMGLGMAGALIGGLAFRTFGWLPGLDAFAISLRDIVAAVCGSLLVLLVLWIWRRVRKT